MKINHLGHNNAIGRRLLAMMALNKTRSIARGEWQTHDQSVFRTVAAYVLKCLLFFFFFFVFSCVYVPQLAVSCQARPNVLFQHTNTFKLKAKVIVALAAYKFKAHYIYKSYEFEVRVLRRLITVLPLLLVIQRCMLLLLVFLFVFIFVISIVVVTLL